MPRPSPALADLLDDDRITAIGLLVEAESALVRVLDQELRRSAGMPLSTYEVLVRLGRSPGHRMRPVERSRQLSLTTGGVTRLIDRIESAGLVRRTTCDTDRRGSNAELTEAGSAALHRATEVHLASLQQHLVDPVGDDGLADLVVPLRRLRDALVGDPAQRADRS